MNNNYFQFIGARLTRDPEIKYTPTQKAFCNLTLAIDTGYGEKKTTNFPRVSVWDKTAEALATYSAKGLRVNVFGRIKTSSYIKDGKTVCTTDLVADRIEFVDFKDKAIKVDYKESSDPVPEFNGFDEDIPF